MEYFGGREGGTRGNRVGWECSAFGGGAQGGEEEARQWAVVSKMATSQPVPDSRRWRGGKWPKNRHLWGVGGEENDQW